ncbi:MAG TPA: hypothetical protein VF766_09355, partial [Pyrinomonadaceae bacterium]
EVAEKTLEVYVEPNTAWPQAEVTLLSENGNYNERLKPITGAPVSFPPPLKPMKYTARINVPGYSAEKKRYPFELYDSYRLDIRLNPEPPKAEDPPQPTGSGGDDSGGITRAVTDGAPDSGGGLKDLDAAIDDSTEAAVMVFEGAGLTIKSNDFLAPLELADGSGKIVHIGQGELYADPEPGFYRARLITPEGRSTEELVELTPGEEETVELKAPSIVESNLLQKILETTGARVMDDGTVEVSEDTGLMASVQVSTIVALAGVAVNENSWWGAGLRQLGLKGFKESVSAESSSGLQILSAVEAVPQEIVADFYAAAQLRLWPFGQPVPETVSRLVPSASVGGLSELSIEARPGQYWLSVELPNQKAIVFSIKILPRRLTMLVFHQKLDGRFRVFQYFLSLLPDLNTYPQTVRRLELMQRFYLNGRLDHVHETYRHITPWNEPLIASLVGLTSMKLGDAKELKNTADYLLKSTPTLSDGYVLAGAHLSREESHEVARQMYGLALNHGLPIFAGNAAQLVSGVQQYDISHPRRPLLERAFKDRISSLLWFAWTPETFSAGERIDE